MKLEYIKDIIGNNYLGITFDSQIIQPFLNEMKLHLSEEDFNQYCQLQKDRDGDHYHMTVINVMEYNSLIKKHGMDNLTLAVEKWSEIDFYPKLMGIGSASKNNNRAFYVVVECHPLNELRTVWGLDSKDLHITLGFKHKDVHGVPKNEILEQPNPFLDILKGEWLRNENWNFIRKIGNYKSSSTDDIIPYNLDSSSLKVAIGNDRLQIGILDGNRLWIMANWVDSEPVTPMSTHEILGILKSG